MNEDNARMTTADHDRRAGCSQTVQITHSIQVSHAQSTLISTKNSAHNFGVKFRQSVCVALVASLTEEMAAQSFAYHAHGTADGDKFSAVIHGLCTMTLNQQCIARSGSPPR